MTRPKVFSVNQLPTAMAAATKKPLIMSTGMATIKELETAVKVARGAGCKDIILLKCTSTYPATPKNINLLTIPDMRERFKAEVGLSDHTLGTGVSIAAVALGATVIERHLTLDRADGGVDAAFSLEPDEMKRLAEESFKVWQAKGKVFYGITEEEKVSVRFRRSIYAVEDIRKGERFNPRNLRVIRPGGGLAPEHYEGLLQKKASCDIRKGTPISWRNAK